MRFKKFSRKQRLAMCWWLTPEHSRKDAVICDGAVRSGKTLCMSIGFVSWAMTTFSGCSFALCGKTVTSLRRNLVEPLCSVLGSMGFNYSEKVSRNYIDIFFSGHRNRFYLFGGKDEGSAALIQGMTLGGVLMDEVGLIREIDGGIKKEVSVSCSAKTRMCSVCGTDLNKKMCSHKPGKIYNGKTAHVILDNITDAYEWSFVAVPAQVNAGVTKRFGGAESSEDSSELLEKLCENLKADVYRLCMAGGNCAYAGILKSAADKMSAAELLEFKNVLEKEHRSKAVSQLGMAENSYKEFRMEGVSK